MEGSVMKHKSVFWAVMLAISMVLVPAPAAAVSAEPCDEEQIVVAPARAVNFRFDFPGTPTPTLRPSATPMPACDLSWRMDGNTLVIEGTGGMPGYLYTEGVADTVPWSSARDTAEAIVIGDGIVNIGANAFAGFAGVKTVSFPESLTAIGESAFDGCSSLIDPELPENLRSIDRCAFRDCASVEELTLPPSVTVVRDYVFTGCEALSRFVIPDRAYFGIGESGLFRGTPLLKTAGPLGSGCNIEYGLVNGKLSENLFFYSGITSLTIPEGITKIPFRFAWGCGSLKSVAFPDSVEEIGDYSFTRSGLETVQFGSGLRMIGDAAFYATDIEEIEILSERVSIAQRAFFWNYLSNSGESCLKRIRLGSGKYTISSVSLGNNCRDLWYDGTLEEYRTNVSFGDPSNYYYDPDWVAALTVHCLDGEITPLPTASPTATNTPLPTSTRKPTPTAEITYEWQQDSDGNWRCYRFTGRNIDPWAEGELLKGLCKITTYSYYFRPETGIMQTGMIKLSDSRSIIARESGPLVIGRWTKVDGKWYLTDNNGFVRRGEWIREAGKWYYLSDEDGKMEKDIFTASNGKKYISAKDGALFISKWVSLGGKWYKTDANGAMKTNSWVKSAGEWYYLGADGVMVKSCTLSIGGQDYTFDADGVWRQ